jgi:nucleoside-diphosphate-sugar epimerase
VLRVAVTGATGFIGRALAIRLSAAGIEHSAVMSRAGETVLLKGVDAVVHLAGIAHRRSTASDLLRHANVEFAEQVGLAAARAGIPMVFVSSAKVHGDHAATALLESAAIQPRDDYARSKARAEALLRAIPGLGLTILRPPLVYGPGVRANFLALMTAIARGLPLPLASIQNGRSLVHVGNLCDAITACVQSPVARGKTFFVTDGAPVSTPALCVAIGEALGRPARLFPVAPALLDLVPPMRKLTAAFVLDDSAIRHDMAWRPPYSFEEGLRVTADWYRRR